MKIHRCRLCGDIAELITRITNGEGRVHIMCATPGCKQRRWGMSYRSREEAVDAWNGWNLMTGSAPIRPTEKKSSTCGFAREADVVQVPGCRGVGFSIRSKPLSKGDFEKAVDGYVLLDREAFPFCGFSTLRTYERDGLLVYYFTH